MISGEQALFEAHLRDGAYALAVRAAMVRMREVGPRIGWAMADLGRAMVEAHTVGQAFACFAESLKAAQRAGTTVAELRRMGWLWRR